MATNTAASFTSHTGNNTAGPFSISFSYLSEDEIDVTVDGVLKTKTTHYTFPSATTISFTSGNHPANSAAIKFQRDTNISAKRVDFEDGSILTETDLDTNTEHLLYGLQEVLNHVDTKVFGSTQIADSAITSAKIADGTVATVDIADDAVTSAKIADNAITSAHIADGTVVAADIGANAVTASELADNAVDTAAIANSAVTTAKLADANITTAKIADDAVTAAKLADDAVTAAKIGTFNLADLTNVHTATPSDGQVLKYVNSNSRWEPAADAQGSVADGDYGEITVSSSGAAFTIDNGVVTTAKLADDAVTAAKIADGSITSAHIAADTVVAADVAANAITASELADNAVDTAAIADNAVTNAKLADDAIGIAELSATGTASSSTFLRGDNTWVTPTDTNTQLTTEEVQDIVGAMFTGNTETNIAATYEDSDGTIDLVVSTGAGGLTNLVEDTSPQLGGNLDVNGKIISLGDSSGTTEDRIVLGTGSDFHIYHPGTDSMIDNNTGNLILRCNVNADVGGDIKLQPKAGEEGIKVIHDGGVELYHDGNLQCKTASYGLDFADNKRADFGNDNDLLIYHDGSHNRIDSANGNIYLRHGTDNAIKTVPDGAVEIYYDDSKKLETKSDGVTVTGNAYMGDGSKTIYGAGSDLEIYHIADSVNVIRGAGATTLQTDANFSIATYSGGETMATFTKNGAVDLYYDGTKKAATYNNGFQSLGNLDIAENLYLYDDKFASFGNGVDLKIYHTGSNHHSNIRHLNSSGNLYIDSAGSINFRHYIDTGGTITLETLATFNDDGAVELYHDNGKMFTTADDGARTLGYHRASSNGSFVNTSYTAHDFEQHEDEWSVRIHNKHASTPYGLTFGFTASAPDNNASVYISGYDTSATRFVVYSDGDVWNHDNSYTGSDQTLKENIVDATSKLEDLKKLKVRNFNWKSEYFPNKSKKKQLGFIAQEVEEVFPSLVSEHDIAPGKGEPDHTPVMKKAIKQAWDPIIIKAMQELIEKVETLETKVAALEAK